MASYIAKLISVQNPRPSDYAEPFAGGAGAALRLLVDEEVSRVHLNDLNPGIAAFWRCVFWKTEEFADRIESEEVNIEAWRRHAEVYANPCRYEDIELGFSTFFLNRCNRSGILDARPIGGLDQSGKWKIDARFNRESLAYRVRFLGQYRERVSVTQLDAREFLRSIELSHERFFVYIDPPYLAQGDDLYLDSLKPNDHAQLASLLRSSPLRWLLTYDTQEWIINDLYVGMRALEFDLAHTAQVQHVGTEYAIFSSDLRLPDEDQQLARSIGRWIVEGGLA